MYKRFVALALAGAMVFSAAACSSSRSEEYPVKLANITVSEAPERVVVLSDSIADILVSCGFIKKIEGRSDECTQEEISGVTSVGSKLDPNLEKISALSPDIVFADSEMPRDKLTELNEAGFTVITFVPATSMSGISELFGNVGAVMAGETTGREIGEERAETLSVTMDDMQRLIPESEVVVTACYLYDENGTSLKDDTTGGKLFEYLNAVNVCKSGVSEDEAFDALKLADPQYIFCDTGVKEKIMSSELFADFSAVKNDSVYELPAELFSRQGNSLVEALTEMAEIMYPSVYADPESSTESEESSKSESSKSESSKSESSESESSKKSESSKTESSKSESSKTESSKSESSKSESSKSESSKSESSKSESSKTESSKSESSKTESSKTETKVEADTSLKITEDMFFEKGSFTQSADDVKKIQNRLEVLGYFDDEQTGYYGDVTQAAVKAFQKANGLTESGDCDYETLKLMFSAKAKAAS